MNRRFITAAVFLATGVAWQPRLCATENSSMATWATLGHDVARSGATSHEIRPPFSRKWYRVFPDEGLQAGVQPVVAGGRVFVGTMRGILHAIDADTGEDIWSFRAGGAILHTCAVADGKVFFGAADGKVYAVDVTSGELAWSFSTGAAVWNSPAVYQATVYIGSRDGKLYALSATDGRLRWVGGADGPILNSPAIDSRRRCLYVGSEDMHVYAFALQDEECFRERPPLWKSAKLPGVTFRGYHAVVAPDGSVMITSAPAASLDTLNEVLIDMVKEVFGDMASWRHTKEENERLTRENLALLDKPDTYERELDYLRGRLVAEPWRQTFFVLDPDTGRPKCFPPIVYAESMNGVGAPPVVTPQGKVIVKYQALLRSRYGAYSPFLNVGYLDTNTGHITPIMDQSRTYGWHDSLLLVHDEQCQLTVAGHLLINTHQDNVNGFDLDTLVGYEQPFCRNIHEAKPGEAMSIWTMLLRRQTLPVGKEWLSRGTAVYGGGSAVDVPVSIAGDSFYYIPTHEINAGCAVIAYRMQPGGDAAKVSPAPTAILLDGEWTQLKELPWDWDTLRMQRLKHVLDALPGKVEGTADDPLWAAAEERVDKIRSSDLDRYIWEVREVLPSAEPSVGEIDDRLAFAVEELVSGPWRPLQFPAGKHPLEAYRLFADPTETLLTLAMAYPHVDDRLQQKARQYVDNLSAPGGPLSGPTGHKTREPNSGSPREAYDLPPAEALRSTDDIVRSGPARLYPLWLWAQATDDFTRLKRDWPYLRELIDREPNRVEEDCRNGLVAGLIAYCRIAERLGDSQAVASGVQRARQAMRERLAYELAHTKGGVISMVPTLRTIFSRWRHLTPEVGRLCADRAGPIQRRLVERYVDYHRPTWWLAWNVETMMRNESAMQLPTVAHEVFTAKAMILSEPADRLRSYLDIPWCKADLFYIQKLVGCLAAERGTTWRDLRR